jgi:hypothetical protein
MSDDSEKVSSRSAVILAIVTVVVAAFAIMYGLQTLVWAKTKFWAKDNPWIVTVPSQLAAPAAAASASATPAASDAMAGAAPGSGKKARAGKAADADKIEPEKAYGLQFIPPWKGDVKIEPSATATIFRFPAGQVVVLFDPQTSVDTLRELETVTSAQYLTVLSLFGPKPFDSNYDLYKSVYGASPVQASPFQDRGEALRLNELLLMKLSFGVEAPGDIFTFEFGNNRGLQFGDPSKGLPVAAHVFNERDDQFRLIVTTTAGSSAAITQNEVDAVLASVGHVPILGFPPKPSREGGEGGAKK